MEVDTFNIPDDLYKEDWFGVKMEFWMNFFVDSHNKPNTPFYQQAHTDGHAGVNFPSGVSETLIMEYSHSFNTPPDLTGTERIQWWYELPDKLAQKWFQHMITQINKWLYHNTFVISASGFVFDPEYYRDKKLPF